MKKRSYIKRSCAVILSLVIGFSVPIFGGEQDFTFLDNMTKEEMQALREEIDLRLAEDASETEEGISDSIDVVCGAYSFQLQVVKMEDTDLGCYITTKIKNTSELPVDHALLVYDIYNTEGNKVIESGFDFERLKAGSETEVIAVASQSKSEEIDSIELTMGIVDKNTGGTRERVEMITFDYDQYVLKLK